MKVKQWKCICAVVCTTCWQDQAHVVSNDAPVKPISNSCFDASFDYTFNVVHCAALSVCRMHGYVIFMSVQMPLDSMLVCVVV